MSLALQPDSLRRVRLHLSEMMLGAGCVIKLSVPCGCSVVTPNSFEAELLTGRDVRDDASALAACDALHDMGPHTVVRHAEHFVDMAHGQPLAEECRQHAMQALHHTHITRAETG